MAEQNQSIEDQIKEKREFSVIRTGGVYKLPCFKLLAGKLIKTSRTVDIPMVRGSRIDKEGNELYSIEGTTVETLLCMILEDLERKQEIVPDFYTETAMFNIQTAVGLLEQRQLERHERGVLGTENK